MMAIDKRFDPLTAYAIERPIDFWRLELAKSCPESARRAIADATRLARSRAAAADKPHKLAIDKEDVDLRAIIWAMRREGRAVAGNPRLAIIATSRAVLSAICAFGAWLWILVRTVGERSKLEGDGPVAFAVHAEWSSRTRHLAPLMKGYPTAPIIALGRAQSSLHGLIERFDENGYRLDPRNVIRPFNLKSAFSALPRLAASILEGIRTVLSAPYLPSARALTGINLRAMIGITSAQWYRCQSGTFDLVIYGHTGTIDTCLLEKAQHEQGVRTMHLFHGASDGLNFHGISSFAWPQSGADARLHARLGGYRRCLAPSAEKPEVQARGDDWLLMSNLLHPMNPDYVRSGTRLETHLLQATAEAAASSSPSAAVTWRPHPVFWALPSAHREEIFSRLDCLKIRRTFEGASLFPVDRAFGFFLTTPSTVAIDLLRRGYLAIVASHLPEISHSYQGFPQVRVSSQEILKEWGLLKGEGYRRAFDRAWLSTRPTRAPTAADLEAIARGKEPG